LVCGITTIARDHVVELGDDLCSIAREKGGIIKPGVPVALSPQTDEVYDVIAAITADRGAPLIRVGFNAGQVRLAPSGSDPSLFSVHGRLGAYRDLRSPLFGDHQLANIGVAVAMAEVLVESGLAIDPEAISAGVAAVRWPGRFQVVAESPAIVLDGAHDGASAAALRDALRARFPGRPITLVVGIGADKDADEILHALAPAAEGLIATASGNPRAFRPQELASIAGRYCAPVEPAANVAGALSLARESTPRDGVICVTGSLYLVGEAFTALGIDPNKE